MLSASLACFILLNAEPGLWLPLLKSEGRCYVFLWKAGQAAGSFGVYSSLYMSRLVFIIKDEGLLCKQEADAGWQTVHSCGWQWCVLGFCKN